MKSARIQNTVIIIAVIALVSSVAWFKSNRRANSQSSLKATTANATVTQPGSSAPTTKPLPRLVDLGAGKCQTCKEMAPILEAVRTEYVGRAVVEVIDVWKNPEVAESYDIRIIPTQIFYDRDGKEVWRHEGGLSKAEIIEKLKSLGA